MMHIFRNFIYNIFIDFYLIDFLFFILFLILKKERNLYSYDKLYLRIRLKINFIM